MDVLMYCMDVYYTCGGAWGSFEFCVRGLQMT